MKINSVSRQSFGINPSNLVRACMKDAALSGKDIQPMIKAMKDVYPYKYMTMLGDFKKVQGIGITDVFDAKPFIDKKLPQKWQAEYDRHLHDSWYYMGGRQIWSKYADEEGRKIFEEHAVPYVSAPRNGRLLFSDIEGKPFMSVINTITMKLQKIKEGFTFEEKIANEIEQQFPAYVDLVTKREAQEISGRAARSINPRIG